MRISKIKLRNFKKFNMSNIKYLEIDINSDIVIILGTNGSGKSSLLHELVPTAVNKSNFNKYGLKELTIQDGNNTYILLSDFTSKKPYEFIVNNSNINDSYNFNNQKELIKEHLGIDDTLKTLLLCSYKFTSMTNSQRKELLNKLNPYNLTYLTGLIKRVSKHIRKLKNNISLLNERRGEISSKLISKDTLEELHNDIDKLTNKIKNLDIIATLIQKEIKHVEDEKVHEVSKEKINKLLSEIESIQNLLIKTFYYKEADVSFTKRSKEETYDNITKLNITITDLEKELKEIEKIINADKDAINKVKEELNKLKPIIKEKQLKFKDFTPIDTNFNNQLNILKEKIEELYKIDLKIKEYNLTYIENKINNYKNKITTSNINLENKLKELNNLKEKSIKIYNIPDTCPKNSCDLYLNYKTTLDNLSSKIKTLEEEINKIQVNIKHDKKVLDLLIKNYNKMSKINSLIQYIRSIFFNCKDLSIPFIYYKQKI